MILIIGGIASGKRTYARSLGYEEADLSADLFDDVPVLIDAQELVRPSDCDMADLARQVRASKQVVICTDVGSGIVPLGAEEREWRERAGRFQRELAHGAATVVRMVCGIPQVLKAQ